MKQQKTHNSMNYHATVNISVNIYKVFTRQRKESLIYVNST
jgi:hypothetical protein